MVDLFREFMIFSLLSLCFSIVSIIELKPVVTQEQFADAVCAHAQDGANASFKTFNPNSILERFQFRLESSDPRTPHVVLSEGKAIGVVLFGYWGSGDAQQEHWDFLPYTGSSYAHFEGIVAATLEWYAGKETKPTLTLSFHPDRCGTCLTGENGWGVITGNVDAQTNDWATDPIKKAEFVTKRVIGPVSDTGLPANVATRTYFSRTLPSLTTSPGGAAAAPPTVPATTPAS